MPSRRFEPCVTVARFLFSSFSLPGNGAPCSSVFQAASIAHDTYHRFFASSRTTRDVVFKLKQLGEDLRQLTTATPNALVTPTVADHNDLLPFNFSLDRQVSSGTQQALQRRETMMNLLRSLAELMGPKFSISAFELVQGELVPVSCREGGLRGQALVHCPPKHSFGLCFVSLILFFLHPWTRSTCCST